MGFLYRALTSSLSLALLAGLLAMIPTTSGRADRGRMAGGDSVSWSVGCDDCLAEWSEDKVVGRSDTTLSVNIAIIALGMVWLTLMMRRMQQHAEAARLSSDDLAGVVLRPAAGGH